MKMRPVRMEPFISPNASQLDDAQIQDRYTDRQGRKFQAMATDARLCRQDFLLSTWSLVIAPLTLLLAYMDIYSTNLSLSLGAIEANPVVHGFMMVFGQYWFVPKALAHVLIAAMIMWWPNKPTLRLVTIATFLLCLAVVNNFAIAFSA